MTTATTQRVPAPLVMSLGDGDRGMVDLLGGKGANLAEMTRLGLPVPHGFVITTEACRAYLAHGQEPAELEPLVADRLRELEAAAGRRFGHPDDPLLVSVRSGARFSMPGMMETILNVGLTDDTLPGLARPRWRPLRMGLLPAAGADVRAHGARHRRRPLRAGAGPGASRTRRGG